MSLEQYELAPLDLAMSEYTKAVAAANGAEIATDAAENKVAIANQELEEAQLSEAAIDLDLSAKLDVLITEARNAEATLVEAKQIPPPVTAARKR